MLGAREGHTAVNPRPCKVAVIGAGAAGLVTARELRKEGHDVVVFEQQEQLGGTWLYTDQVESDPVGLDPNRQRVHSSMYHGLTTNLPREVMGFSDFPFSPGNMAGRSIDSRHFPCSEEVLRYLQAFADHHHLQDLVLFNTHVLTAVPVVSSAATPISLLATSANGSTLSNKAHPLTASVAAAAADYGPAKTVPWPRWKVTWQHTQTDRVAQGRPEAVTGSTGPTTAVPAANACANNQPQPTSSVQSEVFDALLVCNGHYTEPRLPDIPGAEQFPGLLMHSHNYRRPDGFKGQHVAVIGGSFSGLDIARLVSQKAACVYVCAREWRSAKDLAAPAVRGCSNVQRRGMISHLTAAGGAEFHVGEAVPHLDTVICCTGYNYDFPFLDLKAFGLSTECQHVSPLYQHMFPAGSAPGLAFIGLPWRVVPFPMFELQARLCARLLSGRSTLPPAEEMVAAIQQHAAQLAAEGMPAEQSHCLDYRQMHYHAWLATQCGPDVSRMPNWRAVLLHGIWLGRWLYVAAMRFWRKAAPRPASGVAAKHAD